MQSRILHLAVSRGVRRGQYVLREATSLGGTRRTICAQPVRKEGTGGSGLNNGSNGAGVAGGGKVDAGVGGREGSGEARRRAEDGKTEGLIPDVASTSLGMEDAPVDDPLKWRKFVWKYAGAVLLFFVSYKTLHWYVDRLEADGKRRREEMEEDREVVKELERSWAGRGGGMAGGGGAVVGGGEVELMARAEGAQDAAMPALRIFGEVKEEAEVVSELDELYVYRIELDRKLMDLEEGGGAESEKAEVKEELKALATEIAELEKKQMGKP